VQNELGQKRFLYGTALRIITFSGPVYPFLLVRSHTTSYQSATVNIALSCTAFELLDAEYYHHLEIEVTGHSRSLKLAPFDRSHTSSYWRSTVTTAPSCIVFEIKRDNRQISWFFHTPPAFDAPVMGSPSEYCHNVWCVKTRMVWQWLLKQVWDYVTDRQTDTARWHGIASRGKKYVRETDKHSQRKRQKARLIATATKSAAMSRSSRITGCRRHTWCTCQCHQLCLTHQSFSRWSLPNSRFARSNLRTVTSTENQIYNNNNNNNNN